MSGFSHKYNTDNVHTRAVIVGLINLLNQKVQYQNVLSDTDIDEIVVPFYYNYGGDERFLQDYFLEWNECATPKMADGNYDPIPRGIVTMSGNSINTSTMTNRFVRGTYVKEINGELLTFNAYLNAIPLTMNFDVEVKTDTSLDAFKIQQSILETFYKTQVYSVNFRGFRVPCQVGFSEDFGIEKTFEFSYGEEQVVTFKLSLEIETYYPVIDPTTERFNGNRMSDGSPNVTFISDERYEQPRFRFVDPLHGETYFSGETMPIRWLSNGPILRTNLYYRMSRSSTWIPIVNNLPNSGSYIWTLPFFDVNGTPGTKDPLSAKMLSQTGVNARIRAITDATGQVTKILVFNGGSGYTNDIDYDVIYVENPITPNFPVRHEVEPIVQDTILIGARLPAFASNPIGFPPLPISMSFAIELKIEDANDETNYQILQNRNNVTFNGNLTNGSNIINTIAPITNLSIGMILFGEGIQIDAEIINIVGTVITMSKNATDSILGNEITAQPTTPAIIMIE
jgi:hypothetical protein